MEGKLCGPLIVLYNTTAKLGLMLAGIVVGGVRIRDKGFGLKLCTTFSTLANMTEVQFVNAG